MSLNFFIFLSFYFIILISILGYGCLLLSFDKFHKTFFNLGYVGLVGLFLLVIYSYFSNLFIAHSKPHNLILILFGFFSFLYFFKKNFRKPKFIKNFYLVLAVFLILFLSLLIEKNHDDFPYYHFPYTFQLTQDSLNFGIGKLNHGFRTPSSIFYLNSLFFLPIADYFLFNFSAAFILGFANIILLNKILNFDNDKKTLDFRNYLSLLSFIFLNIFFYRLSEHGTDRSAQVLILILFIHLLGNFQMKKFDRNDQLITYLILGLIISLKSFYFLYLIFFIPFLIFILEKERDVNTTLKFIFLNKYFVFLLSSIFFVILINFTNTGCLIYPASFTCFESFQWSLPTESVKKMNDWYELWSKAGANPNFRAQDPEQYILGFNWVENWIDKYFFNKVSDFILGLFAILLILFLSFIKNKQELKKIKIYKPTYVTYFFLLVIFFEWFFNHPSLRYGGYCVIVLLLFIPFSFYLDQMNVNYRVYLKISLIFVSISLITFEIRNSTRILNEVNIYNYKPFKETFYSIDKKYFEIQKIIENSKNNKGVFSKTIF